MNRLILVAIFLVSCSTYSRWQAIEVPDHYSARSYHELNTADRREYLMKNLGYDARTSTLILKHRIWRGMTKQQAELSWGVPDAVIVFDAGTLTERWTYERSAEVCDFLLFRRGILVGWRQALGK